MRSKLSILKSRGWNALRVPAALLKRRMRTLAERLGHGPRAKLLIVHADDLGLAQAVNSAFIGGLETGLISSGSAIVPSRYFVEIAAFARAHAEADIGLHLALTSEGEMGRWSPITSPAQVPSLVDSGQCLLENWTHPGYDNEGLRAFFGNRPEWGAAWRQRDFDFFTSEEFCAALARNSIELIT